MAKVSIIVPVYGVEQYIERCARSLFEQTLDDLEFIFVDDCTKDNSIEVLKKIMDEYPLRKQQTIILNHEDNRGLPQARKTGILAAHGDYLLHCDSDDWLELNACEILYSRAIDTNSDVVAFNIACTDGINVYRELKGSNTENVHQFHLDMMYMKTSWSLVNKLYRRSIYDVVEEYPQKGISEDMALSLQLVTACKIMAYVDRAFYNYYMNQNSMSNIASVDKAIDNLWSCKENVDLILDIYSRKTLPEDISKALSFLKFHVRFRIWPFVHEDGVLSLWRSIYPEVDWKILIDSQVSYRYKIQLILTHLHLYPRR